MFYIDLDQTNNWNWIIFSFDPPISCLPLPAHSLIWKLLPWIEHLKLAFSIAEVSDKSQMQGAILKKQLYFP